MATPLFLKPSINRTNSSWLKTFSGKTTPLTEIWPEAIIRAAIDAGKLVVLAIEV